MKRPNATLLALLVASAPALWLSPSGIGDASIAHEQAAGEMWAQCSEATDAEDARLASKVVSAWEPEIALGELLSRLSTGSSVRLTPAEGLRGVRVSAFFGERPLREILSAIAQLVGGAWFYASNAPATERSYRLEGTSNEPAALDEWYERIEEKIEKAAAGKHASSWRDRWTVYQYALSLTPQQLLAEFERDDPWACVDTLDPVSRGLLGGILSLPQESRDAILARSETVMPLGDLPAPFRSHLGCWATWRWGRPVMTNPLVTVDELPRFTSPEDRWANSAARFRWDELGLNFALDIPDIGTYYCTVLHMADQPPYQARARLVTLGYGENSQEGAEAAKREARAWEEEHSPSACEADDELPRAALVPAPERDDARLVLTLMRVPETGRTGLSARDALEQFAQQAGLAVIANCVPPGLRLKPSESGQELALGDVLDDIRRRRGGAWSWRFSGHFLVGIDGDHRLLDDAYLSEKILAECRERLLPGSVFALDDLARLVAPLNFAQLAAVRARFPTVRELPLEGMQLYGRVPDELRSTLLEPEGLPLTDLPAADQIPFEGFARGARPWVATDTSLRATLHLLPRTLCTGEAGLSFVVQYDLPGRPGDRDVLFTSPARLTLFPPSA